MVEAPGTNAGGGSVLTELAAAIGDATERHIAPTPAARLIHRCFMHPSSAAIAGPPSDLGTSTSRPRPPTGRRLGRRRQRTLLTIVRDVPNVRQVSDVIDYELDETVDAATPERMKAAADPLRMLLLDLVLERAMTVTELAERVGRPKGTVAHHVAAGVSRRAQPWG